MMIVDRVSHGRMSIYGMVSSVRLSRRMHVMPANSSAGTKDWAQKTALNLGCGRLERTPTLGWNER
jgi:hypothetical protein